jgi:hypothetical protein
MMNAERERIAAISDELLKIMTLIAFRCYSNYDLEHMFSISFRF